MKPANSFITGLLTGAVIGGVFALLYAPQSGKETREKLKSNFNDLEDKLNNLRKKTDHKSENTEREYLEKIAALQAELDKLTKEI